MSEHLQLDTRDGKVKPSTSRAGREIKPIDFSEVFVVGLGAGGQQHGIVNLINGQSYIDVVFVEAELTNGWDLVGASITNTVDANPLNLWAGIITSRTRTGFRLQLNGLPDSGNYQLHWTTRGAAIGLGGIASTYFLSGPASGPISAPTSFVVALPTDSTVADPVIVTLHDSGGGGVFSPPTVTLTTEAPSANFTYTPASYGAKSISATNDGLLADPTPLTFVPVAATYTLSGPSGGVSGVASTNFTVALPAGGVILGTMIVTPSSSGGGGVFSPTTVSLTTGAPSATFTYTPATDGAKTISVTNDKGLTNPANLTYTASAPTISIWHDSSGSGNHAIQATPANQPILVGNVVNGLPAVRFDGVDDNLVLTTELTFAGDFMLYIVYQTTGDGCLIGAQTVAHQAFRIGESGGNFITFYDGTTSNSSTLAAARSAWNAMIVERLVNVVYFFEAGTARGTGASGVSFKIGNIGTIGIAPGAIPTNGDIAEVILYNNALSAPDAANVLKYVCDKYAIPDALAGTAVSPSTVAGLVGWWKADAI